MPYAKFEPKGFASGCVVGKSGTETRPLNLAVLSRASYASSVQRLSACVDILIDAGGETKYDAPPVLALLRDRLESLAEQIDADPALVKKCFPELDCGQTGGRSLVLQGGTLLHVAAEYCNLGAAALLLDRGADVNARATMDGAGVGETAIFHAVTQCDDGGL